MFKTLIRVASPLALASLAVPAAANPRPDAFGWSSQQHAPRSAMFAGLTIRVPLDKQREERRRPEVALRFAGVTHQPGMTTRIGEGLALTGSGAGTPRVTFAGRDTAIVGDQIGLSKSAKTALIVGAVVVVALGVVVLVGRDKMGEGTLGDDSSW